MSWYTPTFSTHTRDIHYTFEVDSSKQNNNSGKRKRSLEASDTQTTKKRKIENKPSETKQIPKQKPKQKPKPTTVKQKPKKTILKKTIKSSASIDKNTFI